MITAEAKRESKRTRVWKQRHRTEGRRVKGNCEEGCWRMGRAREDEQHHLRKVKAEGERGGRGEERRDEEKGKGR